MPNRRQIADEKERQRQEELIEKFKKLGAKEIEPKPIEAMLFRGTPGIEFPSLEELALEFTEKNSLSLIDTTDYNFPVVGAANEPRTYESGLILQFKEGVAVLSIKGDWMGDGRLEPLIGSGRPVQSWRRSYVMSGIINEQGAELGATISYSRGTEQQERENELLHYKHFVDVPIGDVRKAIYRHDKNPLWFVKAQDKKADSK